MPDWIILLYFLRDVLVSIGESSDFCLDFCAPAPGCARAFKMLPVLDPKVSRLALDAEVDALRGCK